MKHFFLLAFLICATAAKADPQLTSWFTANSGQYARIYQSAADQTSGTKSSTWAKGSGTQATPAYADVNEIAYSPNWIYIRTTGLASHMMGPWPTNFPNWPSNTGTLYRIPRVPVIPAANAKVKTGLGAIGRFVNGVSFFDNRDAFSYVNSTATEANPGDTIWSRDAYVNELATFDPALAHQAGNNYHYHVQPVALRYQIGDHVTYNAAANSYAEAATAPAHSPIIAWAADGFPVYGPYGYSDPTNASSGVRRMISGYTLRNGTNGTLNLTTAGRHILPTWAATAQGRSATLTATQYGPDVSGTYPLGRYIEDNDFLGDLGFTQTTGATVRDFDLDIYNGRNCVTPEFPGGTYAYFTTINATGTPVFPYNIGRQFYGNTTTANGAAGATNAATMNADTPLTTYFIGGANTPLTISTPAVSAPNVTLTWSSVEGGTYSLDASANAGFSPFTNKATGLVATGISKSSTYATLGSTGTEYGRVNRTALATYDTTGQTAATVTQSATTSYALSGSTSAPTVTTPTSASITSTTATLGGNVTSDGGATVTARGVVIAATATNSNPQIGGTGVTNIAGTGTTGVFTVNVASLTPGTAYTFAAYATNSVGTSYCTTSTFTATASAPVITAITATPAAPTSSDAVVITANVTPSSGRTISQVQMTYNTGLGGTSTVFNESMAAAAIAPWTGTNANNAWTVTAPVGGGGPPPPNPFSQTAAANHTAVGSGNQFGLEVTGGPPLAAIGDGSVANSTDINAVGTAGYIEFYLAAVNQTATTGWNFQVSSNSGGAYTTRLNESNTNHPTHVLFHYDLTAGERVSTLRMRFQFAGGGAGGTGIVRVDDIKVVSTTGSSPVTVTMLDNGANGDGAAGDGVYGYSAIPAQTTGTTVSYAITATDSTAAATTSASNSYTVTAAAPVLAVTPATGLTSNGNPGGAFTPSSATYTLTNSGTGTLNWTAAKTATWLILSGSGGSLAPGANTTVTASFNANANSLSSGVYSDTVTFTSTNGTGTTTRAVSLTVNSNTAPATPALTVLPTYSQGSAKTISWSAAGGATSYTIQVSTASNFSTVLASQTVTSPSATFTNLTSGVTYFYRVIATNNIGSSSYSNVVSSTQDNVAPTVALTSPVTAASTATTTQTVTGTASDALSGISNVTVNGVSATTSDNFATWTVTVPLGYGTNGLTAVAFDGAGNATTTAPVNITLTTAPTNNPLIVPEVMTGTTFDLNLHQTSKRFGSSAFQNTADSTTYAYNNMLFWGPTLIMNKGDWVQINLVNNLSETTTTHWHGFHIPAIMDGGPHQTIPAGTTWKPSFKVDNNAGLYWYHPHLHEFTQKHLSLGAGGLIIIRDPIESALNLPRTYGVDDIPLALTSRRWAANQIVTTNSEYGDYMVVNGVLNPQVTLPKQYVRLRILNAEMERSYNLGFSDGRTFYQIATDGGLVNAPVALTRLVLAVGERCEILVDLTNDTLGSTFNLQAFNSGQANDFPGGEPATTGQFGSLLNNTTFTILKINVGAQTATPVLTRPTTLTTNTFYTAGQVTNTRTVTITNGFPGPGALPFSFDNQVFSPTLINQNVNLNAIEQWNITNTSGFSHSYHIHDIQFHIVSRTGGNNAGVKTYEEGWKDVLFVGQNQTVSFIAKFDGFASNTNPFMYHCHFPGHEDAGLMAQFVVKNNAVEDLAVASFTRYGNNSLISLDFKATPGTTYTLQWSNDLSTWTDVGSVTSDGTSANFTETDAGRLSGAKGFYRVTIPVVP